MSRKYRTWRAPNTIVGQNAPFSIDDEIRFAELQARWSSVDDAISFGRRTLQVALEDAIDNQGGRASSQFKKWDRTADLAKGAHDALRQLLKHIGPSGLPTSIHLTTERVGKRLAKGGKISAGLSPRKKSGGGFFNREDSGSEVEALSGTRDLLREIADHAGERRKRLRHTKLIKDCDYGKQAFVYRLAEGWIFLTGKKPGKGRTAEQNPFLRFVDAALTDAGCEDVEDAFRALDWALKRLDTFERFAGPAPEKSRQSVSGIAARGPAWA